MFLELDWREMNDERHESPTSYDAKTGEFHCKYFNYDREDFVTIPPLGIVKLEVDIEAPAKCNAPVAILTVNFESDYEGNALNLKAWTGKAPPFRMSIPINRRKI